MAGNRMPPTALPGKDRGYGGDGTHRWQVCCMVCAETEYGMKKKLPIDITKVPPEEMVKYEMAKELGLYDQVIEKGWGSLSARQTGKIGGMIAGKKRKKTGVQADGETAGETGKDGGEL